MQCGSFQVLDEDKHVTQEVRERLSWGRERERQQPSTSLTMTVITHVAEAGIQFSKSVYKNLLLAGEADVMIRTTVLFESWTDGWL